MLLVSPFTGNPLRLKLIPLEGSTELGAAEGWVLSAKDTEGANEAAMDGVGVSVGQPPKQPGDGTVTGLIDGAVLGVPLEQISAT